MKTAAVDYEIEGEYPQYGNNDDRVDEIACEVVKRFMDKPANTKHTVTNSDNVNSHNYIGHCYKQKNC